MTNGLGLSKFYCIWVYFSQKKSFPTLKKSCQAPGTAFQKNYPCSKENEVKISKKIQNGQKLLFEVRFGVLRCLFGGFGGYFGGVGGLKILISAPEVPFLVPPNWLKWGRFSQFGGTGNGTSGAEI